MMDFFDNPKIGIIMDFIICTLLLLLFSFLIYINVFKDDEVIDKNEEVAVSLKENKISEEKEEIKVLDVVKTFSVDVKGAVKKPGVFKVNEGTIINDIINLAGGLKSNASTKYLNLSKKVSDEMVIYIYTMNEIKNMEKTNQIKEECICSSENISNCDGSSVVISDNDKTEPVKDDNKDGVNDKKDKNDKVSINTGTVEELMTLSGIGESKALAIIEYRNKNGPFKSIEDIMNVSGIGEAAYNKIKDYITI